MDELCGLSPEFESMWRDNNVNAHVEGTKHIRHPVFGPFAFEYSAFAVDGRQDLSMIVYNPATPADAAKISSAMLSVSVSTKEEGGDLRGGSKPPPGQHQKNVSSS